MKADTSSTRFRRRFQLARIRLDDLDFLIRRARRFFKTIDQRRRHDDAVHIGLLDGAANLRRIRKPEARTNRRVADFAQRRNEVAHFERNIGSRARHAQPSHGINETRRRFGDAFDARSVAGRREQKDGGQLVRFARFDPLRAFFGRQIGNDDAIGARVFGLPRELGKTHLPDRIDVGHRHQSRPGLAAQARQQLKRRVHRGARPQRPFRGALDGRAIGERVGEGNADFQNIGARFEISEGKGFGCSQIGIAAGDKGDERAFLAGLEVGENAGQTIHKEVAPPAGAKRSDCILGGAPVWGRRWKQGPIFARMGAQVTKRKTGCQL